MANKFISPSNWRLTNQNIGEVYYIKHHASFEIYPHWLRISLRKHFTASFICQLLGGAHCPLYFLKKYLHLSIISPGSALIKTVCHSSFNCFASNKLSSSFCMYGILTKERCVCAYNLNIVLELFRGTVTEWCMMYLPWYLIDTITTAYLYVCKLHLCWI